MLVLSKISDNVLLSTLIMPGLAGDIIAHTVDTMEDCDDSINEAVLAAVRAQDGDSVWVSMLRAR